MQFKITKVLYHVRFWATVLRAKSVGQTILIPSGEQVTEISVIPAFVQQGFGIEHDRKNLMEELDNAARLLAEEEELAAEDIEAIVSASDAETDEEDFLVLDDLEEEDFLEDE